MNKEPLLYELNVHESVHPYANPFWLWIRIDIHDEGFHFYLKDICKTKQVCIYELTDLFLKKFSIISTRIVLDTLNNLLKVHKIYSENEILAIDITEDVQLSFDTVKSRERFKKQYTKELQKFINREYKVYKNILSKIN
ncbi:hypothetical protein [Virgibacillus halodenitrificans]|uniref:hypothetical protein n=1 Tax=Virgibacillus halodenitrificans TaxID=1482 RepID=UPI000EF559DF|nr:hypothetical protein [Virgibacillus halodenitrificans]